MEYHYPGEVTPAPDSAPDPIVLAFAEMAAGAIIFGVDLDRLGKKVQNPPFYRPDPPPGYCKHGIYVGFMGVDYMCGRCEDGE